MIKRIALFIITNLFIVITISLVLQILGIQPYLTSNGIDLVALAQFCLVWGLAGSFISLALSRIMAKWMLGVKVIDPRNPGQMGPVVEIVSNLCRVAQLPMPEIGIYESPEINAFATGPTKKRALVAISTGLLNRMNKEELSGVIGHELAHIKNGDMVTMTLLQGVINAFVMFLARALTFVIRQSGRDDQRTGMVDWLLIMVFEMIFGLLGSLVVFWFSRQREFRADAGSAAMGGRENMISALEALQRTMGINQEVAAEGPASLKTFKISEPPSRWGLLLASHPPLEERIARLRAGR